jgi:hypothetical protein
MKYTIIIALLLFADLLKAQTKIPSPETQIKFAVQAAPEEKRAGAKVYGYDSKGDVIVLREGTNEMICLGDDPAQRGF